MTTPKKPATKPKTVTPARSRAIVPPFEGFAINYRDGKGIPQVEITFGTREAALAFADWLRTRKR